MNKVRPDLVAYLVGCAAGLAGLIAFGFVEAWLVRYIGANDFASIWAGPRALALGLDPYDPVTWPATSLALQGPTQQAAYAVYTYPGYVAVALLPLGLLPLPVAAIAWVVGGMCAAAIALRVLVRERIASPASHALLGLVLFLSQPAILTFYDGQWGFVFICALALCVHALERRAPIPAGLAAAVLLAKPTLFLLAIPALGAAALAYGMRRAIVIFVAVAFALVAISLVVFPGWPVPYAAYAATPRLGSARVTTLPVAMGDLLGPIGGILALALLAAAIALALRTRPGQQGFLASWLALSVVIAPYAWSYDLLVLIVPLALIGGTRRGDRALALGAASLLLLATLLHGLTAEPRQSESFVAVAGAVVAAIVVFETVWHPRAAVTRA